MWFRPKWWNLLTRELVPSFIRGEECDILICIQSLSAHCTLCYHTVWFADSTIFRRWRVESPMIQSRAHLAPSRRRVLCRCPFSCGLGPPITQYQLYVDNKCCVNALVVEWWVVRYVYECRYTLSNQLDRILSLRIQMDVSRLYEQFFVYLKVWFLQIRSILHRVRLSTFLLLKPWSLAGN